MPLKARPVEEIYHNEAVKAFFCGMILWVLSRGIWLLLRVFRVASGDSSAGCSNE